MNLLFLVVLALVAIGIFVGVSRLTEKLLSGGKSPAPPQTGRPAQRKPPLPEAEFAAFKQWYEMQTLPAIALTPDAAGTIAEGSSYIGGPVWIADGAEWPTDKNHVPLEFLLQLNCVDCSALDGYPADTILQFFVAREDLFGANFDDLFAGEFKVTARNGSDGGRLQPPLPLETVDGIAFSDVSPFRNMEVRNSGVALKAAPFTDRIDASIHPADERINAFYPNYDLDPLYDYLDSEDVQRRLGHHTGGYPAYTQSDVRASPKYAELDHVLLRLTSDDIFIWGDLGEAVFLMRSDDLAKGDFSRVAYSWDCS